MGDPFLLRLAEALGPALIRALGASLDVTYLPRGAEEARRRRGERVIYAFWHGRMLMPAWTHRFRGVAIMISRHKDGEFIARVVSRLGFVPARGSSTRGGVAGLKAILDLAENGHDLAFTPDGPRGPRYRVQPGVVYAAGRTGLPIIPGAIEAAPAWTLGSWDEFTIPRPFGRVLILEGEPIRVPPDLDDAGIAAQCRDLETVMHGLMARARRMLRETRGGDRR
jgi:hypothetical protein